MDTERKLRLLADASRFDLACACGTAGSDDHRRRNPDGMWLYPVSLPNGGATGPSRRRLFSLTTLKYVVGFAISIVLYACDTGIVAYYAKMSSGFW
jgi:hypothetical protein